LGVDPLHVHHKYYESGKEPWDYDERALLTLCESCHHVETINSKTAMSNLSESLKRSGFMMLDVNRLSDSIERIDYEIIPQIHMTAICCALDSKRVMDELVKMMFDELHREED
jgi:Leu/Phe-tRNA-protein transferase